METIRATEARANIAALLRRVSEDGENFIIERRGKPRAMLVPIDVPSQVEGFGGPASRHESEALLSQAAQMANLGHWVWDEVEDRCVYCSETLARMNGVTVDEYLERYTTLEALLEEVHPEDRARYEQVIDEAKGARRGYDVEFREILPDGRQRHLRERGEPVLDGDGRLIRTVGTLQDITEHKQVETALHESEQRFRDFADATSDWFWEMDEHCRFSYFSERFTEVTGVPQEILLGKTRQETGIPNVDSQAWQEHLSDIAAHRSFRDFQHPRTHPDGHEVLLSINGKAIFDDRGTFKGYRGTGSDITERRRTVETLRKTDALFNETERLAKLGHWEWDEVEDRATYCSEELARLHGVTTEEYLQQAFSLDADLEWVHPEDRDLYRRAMDGYRRERQAIEIEYRLLQPDGEVRTVREVMEPILDSEGELARSIGIVQDITERKRAGDVLKASEADLAKAQHLARIGSWRWSVERDELISGTEEYARIHGVEPDQIADLMAHQMERSVHPDDRGRVAEAFKRFDEEGTDYEIEYRIVRPDGSVRHVKEIGEAILDDSGRVVEQVGTVQDITDFKRIEEELRTARDDLECRVEERTAELQGANVQLREEEAKLREILEKSPVGVAIVSHNVDGTRLAGDRLFVNDAIVKMFGAPSREDFINAKIEDSWVDEKKLKTAEEIFKSRRELVDFEVQRRRMDGTLWWLSMNSRPIRFNDQDCTMVWHFDITERKQAEEALKQSEARLAKTLQQAKLAYWNYRFATQEIEDWSEEASEILGVAAEDLPENFESYLQLVHPEDRSRIAAIYRIADPARPQREHYQIEYRITRPGGEIAWLQESSEIEHDEDGAPIRYLGTIQDITTIKSTEEALRDSEQRLVDAIESISEAFILFDADERLVLCNSKYPETYSEIANLLVPGARLEDLVRVAAERGQIAGTIGNVEAWSRERLQNYRSKHEPIEQQLSDGRWMLVSEHRTQQGGIVGIRRDITESKKLSEELARSEERLRQAVELAGFGHWVWDAVADRCLYCSEEHARIHGMSVADYMADASVITGPFSMVHPEDRERVKAAFQALRNGERIDIEYKLLTPAGEVRHVREVAAPMFDNNGTVVQEHGSIQDVTERMQAEAALRESEERYRELFDDSPAAIWVEDWSSIKQMIDDLARSGVNDWHTHFNNNRDQLRTAYDLAKDAQISRAAIELYRKEDEEHMLEKSMGAVVIDEELDAFCETVLEFQAGRMTADIESKDMAGDGSEIMVRRRVVVPPKYHDDWSRVIYAIEDVTERTRAEEQLRQAQRLEAVGQLTGGVAHDFNNLLAVIMGNAELLAVRLGEDDRQAQAVIRAATRGAELIERLLAFSRQQPLRPQAFDLDAAVAGMADMLRRTLGETIEVKISPTSELWTTEADPGQLENALLNLAINSRDAMPGGGKLVIETANVHLDDRYVDTHPESTVGDYVMLAVSDSGAGMSPDVLEHAIEPFFTTKEVGEGSGLGLSMVYGFVKQSNGQLAIYSEPGHGTTVKLYLPRSEKAATHTKAEADLAVPRGRGETILVVEDDRDVRQLAVTLLEDLDYKVLEAPDGDTALAILKSTTQPDLLLSDVVLAGGLGGPETAREAGKLFPNLKVLFMSGYAESAAWHNGLTGSRSELLNKPFHRQDLARKVRSMLDG